MADIARLTASDFGCIKELALSLEKRGLVLITGENKDSDAADNNGSGKSTILKALTWCLFGEAIDGDRYDEVIRRGAKKAEVSVLLAESDGSWVVTRSRTKGKPQLKLHHVKEGEVDEPWQGDAKAIQAKVVELVGLDFRGFCNTVLYGQGDADRFFSSTDTVQKETLHRALRTDIYRKAELWLREHINQKLKPKVDAAQRELDKAAARAEEHSVADIEAAYNEWAGTQDRRIREKTDDVLDLTRQARQVDDEVAQERGELERRRDELVGATRAQADKDKELDSVARALEELVDKETEALRTFNELSHELAGIGEQLLLLEGDKCPTCTASLARGAPAKHVKQLTTRSGTLAGEQQAAKLEHGRLKDQVNDLRAKRRELREWLDENAVPDGVLVDVESELAALDAEARAQKASLKERAKAALADAEEMAKEENPYTEQLDSAKDRAKKLALEVADAVAARDEAQLELAHNEFWVKGFGVQGLPSLLLDSTMPYLTERANHYLETLANSDITVCFDTQRELKSKKGELRDELEISWTIEGALDVAPSNGQRRKLEVATDLALMDLVSSREGGLNLLLMDEVLDGLDREGVARVLQLLQELRTRRGSVFVVTHEPGLAESFERVVHVTKEGGASTVEEVK